MEEGCVLLNYSLIHKIINFCPMRNFSQKELLVFSLKQKKLYKNNGTSKHMFGRPGLK